MSVETAMEVHPAVLELCRNLTMHDITMKYSVTMMMTISISLLREREKVCIEVASAQK